jgi:UDPglucose--hexose-1-phosphate uridylyltransferase
MRRPATNAKSASQSDGTLIRRMPTPDQSSIDTVREESSSSIENFTASSTGTLPPQSLKRRSDQRPLPVVEPVGPDLQQTHSRLDPISGRWTLFAAHRNNRPNEYVTHSLPAHTSEGCPFCQGNEEQTPPPVVVISDETVQPGDAEQAWGIRVIPNKFPAVDALRPELPNVDAHSSFAEIYPEQHLAELTHRCATDRASEGRESVLFRSRRTIGGHEVFIESPDHYASVADLDLSRVVSLLKVYQDRMQYWSTRQSIQYVSLFKNAGPAAGASLHHPHSQLIALSDLPMSVRTTCDRMRVHHARTGCCLQCDVLRAELKSKRRIVAVTDSLVAYCPYASHLPMLLRITTRRHTDRFEDLNDQEVDELARLIRRSVGWLKTLYPEVAYNYLFNTRPPLMSDSQAFHWSFELFPRLTQIAGFEWSCDTMINPTLPETAAGKLRAIAMQENPMR